MKEKVIIESNIKPEPKEEVIESLLQKGKPLDLSEPQYLRLMKEIEAELTAIKEERKDIDGDDYDSFLENMDYQRKGRMPKQPGRAYNLDCGLTKIKCDDIVRTISAALLDVEPIFSISPRPGYAKGEGAKVCTEQQEYLDYVLDEKIPMRPAIRLAASSAIYKKVGMIKWVHKVRKEPIIKHEKFIGNPIVKGINQQNGQPIIENKGLEDFMLMYNDAVEKNPEKYKWIIKRLMEGKKAEFDVEYNEVVYNDPFPKFVDNKNFYVRKGINGYLGLCETKLIAERVPFSYYELRKLEKEFGFINIDKLIQDKDGKNKEGYESEIYNIFEYVYYFRLNETDDDYVKVVCFGSEDENIYIGGIYYPYTVIGCYYAPHYVKCTDTGFYQESVAEDITDIHLSKNAILNHTLEAAHLSTTITPIVEKDSNVTNQFLNNTWINGLPIYSKPSDIDFLSNRIKPVDIGGLLLLDQTLSRIGSEQTGVSDLRSGRETPLDPNAPGNKTAMLLQESGKNVKDYVDVFSQCFSIDAQIILEMYFEMGQDEQFYYERKYRTVTGGDAKKISKAAMIAKTNIQSQAMAYDFDKLNAKREDLLINNYMKNETMCVNNPRSNYERVRMTMSSWSPKWKHAIDKILPSPEEFNQQQAQIALNAVQQYIQAKIQEAQVTGQPPKMLPEELVGMVTKMQAMATMPVENAIAMQEQEAKANK